MNNEKRSKVKMVLAVTGAGFCVLGAVMVFGIVTDSFAAQGPSELTLDPDNQERIVSERRARDLQTALDLDEEQVRQLTESVMALREEGRRLREENAGNMLAMMASRRQQIQAFDAEVRSVLRDDQLPQYEEFKSLQMSRMGAARELAQNFFHRMHADVPDHD